MFCEKLSAFVVGVCGQTDIQREDVAEFDTCPQWTQQECHSGLKLYFEAFRRVRAEIEVFVSNPFLKTILTFSSVMAHPAHVLYCVSVFRECLRFVHPRKECTTHLRRHTKVTCVCTTHSAVSARP